MPSLIGNTLVSARPGWIITAKRHVDSSLHLDAMQMLIERKGKCRKSQRRSAVSGIDKSGRKMQISSEVPITSATSKVHHTPTADAS